MEEPHSRAGRPRDRVLVVRLVEELNRARDRAGSTHIQKLVFFLKHAWAVSMGYEFVIYHYGPYSFSLSDDLMLLRSRGWLQVAVGAGGLGVHYSASKKSLDLVRGSQDGESSRESLAMAGASAQAADSPGWGDGELRAPIREAVARLGHRSTRDLELLATTFYMAKGLDRAAGAGAMRPPTMAAKVDAVQGPNVAAEARGSRDQGSVAGMVVRLKPHFTVDDVGRAYQELVAMGFLGR